MNLRHEDCIELFASEAIGINTVWTLSLVSSRKELSTASGTHASLVNKGINSLLDAEAQYENLLYRELDEVVITKRLFSQL